MFLYKKQLTKAINYSIIITHQLLGIHVMAHWRSGLTHIPLKDTFMGSNPVWVTICGLTIDLIYMQV